MKPEGGVPYACQAATGYYTCLECGFPIHAGDFIQGPKARKRGNKMRWHYNCDDPQGNELYRIAAVDRAEAPLPPAPKRYVHGFRR